MVLIAFTLNYVIYNAIQASFTGLDTEYLFCSNVKNQNRINLPYWTYSSLPPAAWPFESISSENRSKTYPGSKQSFILMANFIFLNGFWAGPYPCTYQFGLEYEKTDIYNNPVFNVSSPNLLRDTTMLSQPLSGWIPTILNGTLVDGNSYNIFLQFQQRTNALLAYDASAVDPKILDQSPNSRILQAHLLIAHSCFWHPFPRIRQFQHHPMGYWELFQPDTIWPLTQK